MLTVRLDGDTDQLIAEYGNAMMDSIAELKKQEGANIVFDIKADQLLVAQLSDVDERTGASDPVRAVPTGPTRFGGPGGV